MHAQGHRARLGALQAALVVHARRGPRRAGAGGQVQPERVHLRGRHACDAGRRSGKRAAGTQHKCKP